MRRFAACFAAGSFAALRLPAVPEIAVLLSVTAGLVAVGLWWRSLSILSFVLGCLWVLLAANERLADRLSPSLQSRDLWITGEVLFAERRGPDDMRITLASDSMRLPRRLQLNWYRTRADLEPGQIWRLKTRLWRPRGMRNPGAVDYEAQLFRQGIGAVGYVRDDTGNRMLGSTSWRSLWWRIRRGVDQGIASALRDHPAAPVIRGIVTGFREAIPQHVWQTMRATGTVHLMAISGLHIGIAAMVGYLLGLAIAASLSGVWSVNTRVAGAWSGWILASAYAALAGFGLPTVRALVMLGVVGLALLVRREVAVFNGLCIAMVIVLLHDPLAMLGSGFWLSFGAVGAILWGLVAAERRRGRIRSFLHAQCALSLILTPILAQWYGEVPLTSIPANIVAVPLFSIFVVPAALAGTAALIMVPPAGAWLLHLVADILQWFLELLELMALAPLTVAAPGIPATVVMIAGALLLTGPAAIPGRWIGIVMLGLPFFVVSSRLSPGEFELTVLDVGQGLSVIVTTRRHALVYDTGPSFRSGADTGAIAVLPALRGLGVRHPDLLMLSHGDIDHVGGAQTIVTRFPRMRITGAQPMAGLGSMKPCARGQRWTWDDVAFEVLHPPPSTRFERDNDVSCVLRIESVFGAALLTGDIERFAERVLLGQGDDLRSDVVVAPHHGSTTSSSDALVAATQPAWVVFPAAVYNRWGFPAAEVVARWHRVGAERLQTGRDGAVTFRFVDGRVLTPRKERQRVRRIWHEP